MSTATLQPPVLLWPGEGAPLDGDGLDHLLAWASREGVSDIRLQSDRRIILQRHGRVYRGSQRPISGYAAEGALNRLYGADGVARIKGGNDFDVAYVMEPDRSGRPLRFRVNGKGTLVRGTDAVSLVVRTLPTVPRGLETQNVEPEILEHFQPHNGLVFIAGGTGEGKSTLAAGFILHKLKDTSSHRIILEYSAPIEYVYDDEYGDRIEQVEIGRHIATFAEGIRNAMRGAADDIVVGECRDTETMSAAIHAGLSNHAVYTTIHAGGNFETIQRAVSMCPADQRVAMTVSMAQTLRLIVNQRLVWAADGTRTPIREYLVCDQGVRRKLAATDPGQWPQLVEALNEERGTTFMHSVRRAFGEKRITEGTAEKLAKELGNVA